MIALCTSVHVHLHGLQTTIVICIDMARWWWVQTLQLLLGDYNLDLNKQLCFIIDSLLNICDWQECTIGGTTYGTGDYLHAMNSPRGIICCAMYGPWFCCGQTIFGGSHMWQAWGSYAQELASFPGYTMVLGTRLAQEYVTSTRIMDLSQWTVYYSILAFWGAI